MPATRQNLLIVGKLYVNTQPFSRLAFVPIACSGAQQTDVFALSLSEPEKFPELVASVWQEARVTSAVVVSEESESQINSSVHRCLYVCLRKHSNCFSLWIDGQCESKWFSSASTTPPPLRYTVTFYRKRYPWTNILVKIVCGVSNAITVNIFFYVTFFSCSYLQGAVRSKRFRCDDLGCLRERIYYRIKYFY